MICFIPVIDAIFSTPSIESRCLSIRYDSTPLTILIQRQTLGGHKARVNGIIIYATTSSFI